MQAVQLPVHDVDETEEHMTDNQDEQGKPHLTVLVGAGASIPIGIPSTGALTELALEKLNEPDERFVDAAQHRQKLTALLGAARSYYGEQHFNFEHLFEVLESANALKTGWKPGNAATVAEASLTIARPALAETFDGDFISDCTYVLTSTILDAIRTSSAAVRQHSTWATYSRFWRALAERFTLTVGTLNYDTSVEQALELGASHQGMSKVEDENVWRLDVSHLTERRLGHRLFHLHGGIHFGDREYGTDANRFAFEADFHELYWHESADAALQTAWGRSSPRSQGGRSLEGGRIVSGFNKPDKLIVEPLASYYGEFGREIVRCPRLLVIGYGFNDLHVNALLGRLNRAHGSSRRIGVIDRIDPVWEHGSDARHHMLTMLHQWAEESCRIDPDKKPYPLLSAKGHLRFYWKGLEEAAGNLNALASFLEGAS